jgi:anaerobic C4-dicarboxylate transporter DcuA
MARLLILRGQPHPFGRRYLESCAAPSVDVPVGLFGLSSMLFSAAAAVVLLAPIGVALGMSASQLVSFYPAASGNFFLPTYGTLLAAVSFDQTGTTRIGKYLLNHSFMLPGLVTMFSAIAIALLLSAVVL